MPLTERDKAESRMARLRSLTGDAALVVAALAAAALVVVAFLHARA